MCIRVLIICTEQFLFVWYRRPNRLKSNPETDRLLLQQYVFYLIGKVFQIYVSMYAKCPFNLTKSIKMITKKSLSHRLSRKE